MKLLKTLAACLSLAALAAHAQAGYPNKPVKIIVPFAPGGATDYIARVMAEKLGARMGQSFIVENRVGAGGAVGTEVALRAAPDGYTLLVASASYAANAAMMKLGYDPVHDAVPVVNMVIAPSVFLASKDAPFNTMGEMIAYARANPDKLSYATQGNGSITHMSTEAFMASTGIRMVHIPYKGVGPALNALAAGEVQVLFTDPGASYALASAGKVKVLAIAGRTRLAQFPSTPTSTEAGFPQLSSSGSWQGMFAPRGTPAPVVAALNRQVNEILRAPEVAEVLQARFARPVGGSSAEFAERVKEDIQTYTDIVRKAGIKGD